MKETRKTLAEVLKESEAKEFKQRKRKRKQLYRMPPLILFSSKRTATSKT